MYLLKHFPYTPYSFILANGILVKVVVCVPPILQFNIVFNNLSENPGQRQHQAPQWFWCPSFTQFNFSVFVNTVLTSASYNYFFQNSKCMKELQGLKDNLAL